jgi:hypothetical protein
LWGNGKRKKQNAKINNNFSHFALSSAMRFSAFSSTLKQTQINLRFAKYSPTIQESLQETIRCTIHLSRVPHLRRAV